MAQKNTTTLYSGFGDANHTAIASRGYVAPTALIARFKAVLLMCRPYGASCVLLFENSSQTQTDKPAYTIVVGGADKKRITTAPMLYS